MLTPEHLHLALNHFPVLGMPFAGALAAWGLVRKNRDTLRAGLVLMTLCAALTPAVMTTGEQASDNYNGAEFIDSAGFAWMTTHGERAAKTAFAAYAAGALATGAFVAGFFRETIARALAIAAILAALATAGLAVWTADAGGKIRRPDFREPAPETSPFKPKST